jgi:hypothetical protein
MNVSGFVKGAAQKRAIARTGFSQEMYAQG